MRRSSGSHLGRVPEEPFQAERRPFDPAFRLNTLVVARPYLHVGLGTLEFSDFRRVGAAGGRRVPGRFFLRRIKLIIDLIIIHLVNKFVYSLVKIKI